MALRRRPVGWCAQFKGDKYLNYPNDPPPRAGAGLSNPRPMLIPPSSVWGALSTSGKTFAEEAREEAATIANGAKPPPMLGQIGRSTTLLVKPPVGGSAGSDFGFGSGYWWFQQPGYDHSCAFTASPQHQPAVPAVPAVPAE